ncbi:MATE family efflux transporter [Hujiaoplasma nucleasis]|uniref:Multidrug export protein MepA n=1 Tax=Hujiaoplasma nucleasis TaxID=2725268 RepID=A0A7L6N6J2_9MOLU|nr:MATE family efflux transporter [Hujiaoplasma nucleasis]QLY40877.1 MATE family efflux transporter [Hujiaoplasma nucleasis]
MATSVNKKNETMLKEMNIKKLLIKLAIPSTLAMIVNALYNLVDTFFVSLGLGTDAIGALTIAYPIQLIVLAIGLMLGVGSASVFSRAFGRKDYDTMKKAVNTAIILNISLTLIISFITYIYLDDLLIFFGATSGNIAYARDYLLIILIALVPFSLGVMMNNLTRAEGRVKIAMWSLVIGAGLNIILDPIFIFDWGFNLGVKGAAYATLIGKTAAFIFIFLQAFSRKSSLRIDLKSIYKIDLSAAKEMILIGAPSFARVAMGSVLIILVNNLIKDYAPTEELATDYQAIYGVINRLIRFSLMPGFGLVQGMVPIVGYNFGAKTYRRVYGVISYASKLLFIYFTFALIMIMFFSEPLFSIFTKAEDATNIERFIDLGSKAFRIVAIGFSFVTYQVVLSSSYQAMGYPLRAFLVALSRRFILFIPFAILLTYIMGIDGIWWTFVVADVVTGTISFIVYKKEMLELKSIIVRL